mmetsp:Transcript_44786/g.57362  ORF Transcript_44786/g.57362 Transcript_44786/m.57362 type:complete len:303 (-) Transcript_44786:256-1164(-)
MAKSYQNVDDLVTTEKFECEICLDSINETVNFHSNRICNFKCCKVCASTFLEGKILEHQVNDLVCPSLICDDSITSEDVTRILTNTIENQEKCKTLLKAYQDAYNETVQLRKDRDQRLHAPYSVKFKNFCSDQVDVVRLGMWRATKDSKRCPGCRMIIEKNGGCNHMTCGKCRHAFHWCCLQSLNAPHNDYICIPCRMINDQNPLWGPIMPIRGITKTVAAVAVPSVVIAITPVVIVVGGIAGGSVLIKNTAQEKYYNWKYPPGQLAAQLRLNMEAQNEAIRSKFHPKTVAIAHEEEEEDLR